MPDLPTVLSDETAVHIFDRLWERVQTTVWIVNGLFLAIIFRVSGLYQILLALAQRKRES